MEKKCMQKYPIRILAAPQIRQPHVAPCLKCLRLDLVALF